MRPCGKVLRIMSPANVDSRLKFETGLAEAVELDFLLLLLLLLLLNDISLLSFLLRAAA